MSLADRCVKMCLDIEWSANRSDGNGPRCPWCDAKSNRGLGPHENGCSLGQLCADIKLVREAERVKGA
jgi:hypothetical protein